jgi:hypothetical protein
MKNAFVTVATVDRAHVKVSGLALDMVAMAIGVASEHMRRTLPMWMPFVHEALMNAIDDQLSKKVCIQIAEAHSHRGVDVLCFEKMPIQLVDSDCGWMLYCCRR